MFTPLSCNLFSLCVLREENEDELPATLKVKVQEIHILDTCSKDIRKRTKDKENERESSTCQSSSPKPLYTFVYVPGGLKLCVNGLGLWPSACKVSKLLNVSQVWQEMNPKTVERDGKTTGQDVQTEGREALGTVLRHDPEQRYSPGSARSRARAPHPAAPCTAPCRCARPR